MLSLPWKKIGLGFLFLLIFLVGLGGSYFFLKFTKIFVKSSNSSGQKFALPAPNLTDSTKEKPDFNVLLLGYGGSGHSGGNLSDTMIVANINSVTKKITLITVPRDLWVPIPVDWDNTKNFKINAAYAIGEDDRTYPNKKPEFRGAGGAGSLSKYVVAEVTGLDIKYFIAVDFDGLITVVDLMGGVDVDVPKTFDDYFYPVKGLENETCGKSPEEIAKLSATLKGFELEKQFTCRYEHLHFDKGLTHMNGETALKFVRSRHSDQYGGDFARSERQKALLVAMRNKIVSLGIIPKMDPILNKLFSSVKTDISLQDMANTLAIMGDTSTYQIGQVYLNEDNVLNSATSSDGQSILVPKAGNGNWSEIQKFIQSGLNSN